jgi:hypothetical protein
MSHFRTDSACSASAWRISRFIPARIKRPG